MRDTWNQARVDAELAHYVLVVPGDTEEAYYRMRSTCDLCDGLPGERYDVLAFKALGDDPVTYEVCPDCLMYVANGDTPEDRE